MARERVERLWIGGGSAAAALMAVVAWTMVVHPKLSDASSLRSQTDSARTDNTVLQVKINKLKRDSANLGSLQRTLAQAHLALPADAGLDAFTRQIAAEAAAAHVTATSITAGAPTPLGGTASPAAGTGAATTTSPSAAPSNAPAGAAIAPSGVYGIPVTVAVTGPQQADLQFLHTVQTQGGRAVLVTSTQLAGSGAGSTGGTTLTIQLQAFAAPQPAGPSSSAAPSGG